MACEKPMTAYQPVAENGPVRFTQPRDGRAYKQIQLPCGTCILCRQEHARQWAVRITNEAQLHEQNCFITLTYDDEHLPEFSSLSSNSKNKHPWQQPRDRKHTQKFIKRLRYYLADHYDQIIRYFLVGEYGDETNRPHYHACIFGHAFIEDRIILRQTPTMLWTNPVLQEAWGKGHVSVGALTFQTAQYTASYVTKKLASKKQYVRIDEHTGELVPLVQPRAYMSLRPAIGRDWLDLYGQHTYDHDRVIVDGRPHKPPKYYDQWLAKLDKAKLEKTKNTRKSKAVKLTEEETRARAQNARAHAKSKSKTL